MAQLRAWVPWLAIKELHWLPTQQTTATGKSASPWVGAHLCLGAALAYNPPWDNFALLRGEQYELPE